MKIDYFMADPAGNITTFVTTPLDESCHTRVAAAFFARPRLRTEQVAFLLPPVAGGHLRCRMSGGEFCGNAARAAGYYYARQQGWQGERQVLVEMSGAGLLAVRAQAEAGLAYISMPLPLGSQSVECWGRRLDAVLLDGIAHVIVPGTGDPPPADAALCSRFCRELGQPALGLMFLDIDSRRLRPLVWVEALTSLVWENSCGSGSTACAWWLSRQLGEGRYSYSFFQPGGVLQVDLAREAGRVSAISMGGAVSLGELSEMEL